MDTGKPISPKTLILINPGAKIGEQKASAAWEKIGATVMDAIAASGDLTDQVRIHWTTSGGDISEATRHFLSQNGRKIVVVGGDGTFSGAVHGAFEKGKPVSEHVPEFFLLPAGRGNDFFKVLAGRRIFDRTEAWQMGLQILRSGHSRPIDVGLTRWRVNGVLGEVERAWANVASFGFPGLVVKQVFKKADAPDQVRSRRSKTAATYLDSGLSSLVSYRPIRFHIRVDGQDLHDGEVFSGFVLNGRYNAGGVCWSDQADPGDGLFEVLVQSPKNILFSLLDLPRLWSGRWRAGARTRMARGKIVEIQAIGPLTQSHPLFEVDGDLHEPAGCEGAQFELLPHAIQVGCLFKKA